MVKVDAANDLALLKAVGAFKPLPIAASRTVKLGGTVATVGQKANAEGRMKNEETGQQPGHATGNSAFILLPSSFPLVAAGECELCGEEQPALELPGIG